MSIDDRSQDRTLTPKEIQSRLDEYVIGQTKAKRAVAVALRNRWRRRQLSPELAQEVYPKNILLIGPTGVGKTEIARRLADLAGAPFIKVEASKYSEVGYHGRDVESMVRDLMEAAVAMVQREHAQNQRQQATERADERILRCLFQARGLEEREFELQAFGNLAPGEIWRPPAADLATDAGDEPGDRELEAARQEIRAQLAGQELEDEVIELEVLDRRIPSLSIFGPQGSEAMGIDTQALQEAWGRSPVVRTRLRRLTVAEARRILVDEEAEKLVDQDAILREAQDRCENEGIIFLDEIDKILGAEGGDGPDVSREGVQRDLLPLVEGCSVYTKHAHVRTDHILFIAAGAFHFGKPSELIPELQGRFPVRVALRALTEEDFVRILQEPKNSLVRQYQALFGTEGVTLSFTRDGIERLAAVAFRANKITQNIGARRLFTILEKCLEDLSFEASERAGESIVIDSALVAEKLGESADDEDLIPYDM